MISADIVSSATFPVYFPYTRSVPFDERQGKMCQFDLLTVHEVALSLRVDDSTIRRWIKRGTLPAITLPSGGGRPLYRIARQALDALVSPALEQGT